jgi:hypothetical protein
MQQKFEAADRHHHQQQQQQQQQRQAIKRLHRNNGFKRVMLQWY